MRNKELAMGGTILDSTDRRLLGLLQMDFPLAREPFDILGLKLGVSSEEVIRRIQRFKDQRIVRQISPVFDARKLGYQSTLVAMKVPQSRLQLAGKVVSQHPGISHGYLREHDFNVWVTLSVHPNADIGIELGKLASAVDAETVFDLPALRVFKLRAYFGADGAEFASGPAREEISQRVELSITDRKIINEIQQDLPLKSGAFDSFAARLNIEADDFLKQCQSLLDRGVIRRYGAAINHRNTGYRANAMVCWIAREDKVETAGRKLASLEAVSHCYERKTNSQWQHNLFAMIHGYGRADCSQIVSEISDDTGMTTPMILYSTREFKKTRIIYEV
jgi:DNA-binding Lrp family transcriptional regulator